MYVFRATGRPKPPPRSSFPLRLSPLATPRAKPAPWTAADISPSGRPGWAAMSRGLGRRLGSDAWRWGGAVASIRGDGMEGPGVAWGDAIGSQVWCGPWCGRTSVSLVVVVVLCRMVDHVLTRLVVEERQRGTGSSESHPNFGMAARPLARNPLEGVVGAPPLLNGIL